jgi:hypothetical protein
MGESIMIVMLAYAGIHVASRMDALAQPFGSAYAGMTDGYSPC